MRIARLHVSQIRLVGVDLMIERVMVARHETAAHNQRVGFTAADACHLPFRDNVFDSTFCVAVLQHIDDVDAGVLTAYAAEATNAGSALVEIQNTMLFATVGQKTG